MALPRRTLSLKDNLLVQITAHTAMSMQHLCARGHFPKTVPACSASALGSKHIHVICQMAFGDIGLVTSLVGILCTCHKVLRAQTVFAEKI